MAAITPTAGGSLNLTPSPQKQTLSGNYLDFAGTTDTTWAQQYLPELMETEASQVFFLKLEQKNQWHQIK